MAATHITDYPQLLSAVTENERIVYLCGAGASMPLGDHKLNWPKWILAGKGYLDPADQEELKRRMGARSTTELIDAATFLLQKLKTADAYVSFMDKTIGSFHPVNVKLMEAFRRMWRAGDLIASTNYDLQIEEAVGAEAISYSNPSEILSIIRGKSENKVIHLHGLYDKLGGRDDIVADDPQYKGISANAGAQFIQQLIGTYPIIIVGCGGTVEDPNLSGFMSFAVEKLGMTDIPYFYLMKQGDTVPVLPANAVPIYYGDDYPDLPIFLSELTALRLRKRAMLRELVAISPYQDRPVAASGFGRMHFSNGFSQFTGRAAEFRSLNELLNASDPFAWQVVLGEGGIGKSRLVLEWIKNIPTHWFGFFARKNIAAAKEFKPFTDTVIVFDYVLGEEDKCAAMLEAFMDAFRSSAYKLRVLFLERSQRTADSDWLVGIKRRLDTGDRLMFDASQKPTLLVTELSPDDEISYIQNYLDAYLPIISQSEFVENCTNDLEGTSTKIEEAFRRCVEPSCYRPLYLSIFIEVWLSKEGNLSLDGVEELLNEYIHKEKGRWQVIFGEEKLVDAYLRLLAVACAIGRFNITDVYGDNYLEEDCKRLTEFLDEKSSRPGADSIFTDIFIEMDELEENIEDDSVLDMFFATASSGSSEEKEASEFIASLSEEERFAYAAPYIKLDADPVEVYLNMLVGAGAATEEQMEELQRIRESRQKKEAAMPDHAWILCPIFPDIINEYLVSYVVSDIDIKRFTKLARSNSILGLERFITLALEDWSSKKIFQRMAVTPPAEMLNYFEYYVSILLSIDKVQDLRAVESALLSSDPCFTRYEMELWRRISIVLTDRGDVERLYDSALRFIEYVKGIYELVHIRDEVVDVMEGYFVGLHNAEEAGKYSDFLQKCDEMSKLLPKNTRIGLLLCENYGRLIKLKLYQDKNADVEPERMAIKSLLERYDYPENMCVEAMGEAQRFLLTLTSKGDLERLKELEGKIEALYAKHPIVEIADVAALCAVNIYCRKPLPEEYEKIKQYMAVFPDSMRICSAYVVAIDKLYAQTASYRKVPDKLLAKAKAWSLKYPDEIEFQEGYFGLLKSRLAYARSQNMRNEQRRVFREMVDVSRRADYSKYNEQNQLVQEVEMLRILYGY